MESQTKMQYRFLGKTGLQVSAISLGFADATDQESLNQIIKRAYELGINFFDCAEGYGPDGLVEKLLGNALKALNVEREDLVITTKIFFGLFGPNRTKPNRNGLSRKHLIEGALASLKRLQLDYVDVIFAHRYDPNVPMEEIVRGFDYIVNHGYAFYWGTSEWPADKVQEAFTICEKYNLIKPIAEQPEYSMLARQRFEKEYANLFKDHGYGSTIWSPLAAGVLTGKYNKEDPPKETRLNDPIFGFMAGQHLTPEKIDNTRRITRGIEEIAKELGTSSATLALAWTLKNPDVSTAIIGARRVSQLEENVKAIDLLEKLTPEVEKRIEEILKNRPTGVTENRIDKSSRR